MDDRGSIPGKYHNLSVPYCVQTDSGVHPASIQWVLATLSSGLKWLAGETGHSLSCSAGVKKQGAIPPQVFMIWYLIN
jgi:hypothetical protein